MEFKYPSNILFMGLAAAAVVFFVLAFGKKEKIMALVHMGSKIRLKTLRAALLGAGLGLLAFSLLGPQVFEGFAEVSTTGLDIYILMDTSKSMLVNDIAPDRITIAKKIVGELLDHLEGDRIGFIPFASDAYIQMPLTDDTQLAHMFLDVMDTEMISGGGTNLAAAIRLANASFERASGADRVIIILSDGEEHDGDSLEQIQSITDEQVKIFTVGVGTEKGGLVPVYNGDTVAGYMKDEDGNPVTSRLQADTLRQLARDGRGSYVQATPQGTEITSLLEALDALQRERLKTERMKQYAPLYQFFLGAGLLLFMTAWFLPEKWAERRAAA